MDTEIQVQILNEAVCISYTHTLGKDMNLIILPSAMGKIVGQIEIFNFGMPSGQRDGKLWLQTY